MDAFGKLDSTSQLMKSAPTMVYAKQQACSEAQEMPPGYRVGSDFQDVMSQAKAKKKWPNSCVQTIKRRREYIQQDKVFTNHIPNKDQYLQGKMIFTIQKIKNSLTENGQRT